MMYLWINDRQLESIYNLEKKTFMDADDEIFCKVNKKKNDLWTNIDKLWIIKCYQFCKNLHFELQIS